MKFPHFIALVALSVSYTVAHANGLEDDRSWTFEDPNAKMYKLNARVIEKKLKADGYTNHNSFQYDVQYNINGNDKVVLGDDVAGDKNTPNYGDCINCSTTSIDVKGNGNSVGSNTNQNANHNTQSDNVNVTGGVVNGNISNK